MKRNDSNKQIKGGVVISYIGIAVNILMGLIYTPWIIHQVGDSGYGLYTLATSFISIFTLDFGLSTATTRFVAKYVTLERYDQANVLVSMICKLYLIISAVLLVVLTCLYPFLGNIYKGLSGAELVDFRKIFIMVGVYSVISMPFITLNGILTAYEQFVGFKVCDLLHKLMTVLFVVSALVLHGGLYSLVFMNILSGLLTIVFKLAVIHFRTNTRFLIKAWDKNVFKEICGFSAWTMIIGICTRLIFNIMPSIMGMVSSSDDITRFSLSSSLEGYSYLFISVIGGFFITRVTQNSIDNNQARTMKLMINVGRIQMVLITMIVVGFASIGKTFIAAWMGEGYEIVYPITILLLIPSIFESTQQIADTVVVVENRVKEKALAYIVMAVLNIILSFVCIPIFGALGAGISICVAYSIRTLIMNVIYHKKLNIDLKCLYKKVYLPMIVPALCTFVLGSIINRFVPLTGWWGVLVNGVCIMAIYLLLVTALYLKSDERRRICNLLKGKVPKKFRT